VHKCIKVYICIKWEDDHVTKSRNRFRALAYTILNECREHPMMTRPTRACVDGVALWMSSNHLQLNAEKTEFMWCVPPRRRHHLPTDQLTVQSTSVAPVTSVRDLGVHLDSDMSMHTNVTQLVCSCYGVLRQLRSIYAGRCLVQH